jgi:hypothetical protein
MADADRNAQAFRKGELDLGFVRVTGIPRDVTLEVHDGIFYRLVNWVICPDEPDDSWHSPIFLREGGFLLGGTRRNG